MQATGSVFPAIYEYRQAVSLRPDQTVYRFNLALAYRDSGDFADAEKEMKEVIRQDPENPAAHIELAATYRSVGNHQAAITQYREALRLKPDYSAAYRELGKSLVGLGRLGEARGVYAKGAQVACEKGDVQTQREIEVFLRRLENTGT